MKKYIKYFIILAVLTGIYFGYNYIKDQNAKEAANPTKFVPNKFKVINVSKKDIENDLTLSGSIDASKKAILQFQTSGQLAWVGVKVGDKVKKWQAIAGLDQKQLRKNLETQLNNYKTGLSNFNDTQDTYKQTKQDFLVTDEIQRILDRSQYSLNNSVISYELNDLAIKYSTLTTPIDGIVVGVDQPLAGVNVTPLNANFTIVDPTSIYLKAEIDQEDTPKIKVGQSATVKLDSFPDQNFDSKINFIAFSPVVGESNTVYEIRFDLPSSENQNLNYRLGMDGDAIITLEKAENTIVLPIEAVLGNGQQQYVLTKTNDNKIIKKNIKTGIENDTEIEILEGLKENDQVVIKQK